MGIHDAPRQKHWCLQEVTEEKLPRQLPQHGTFFYNPWALIPHMSHDTTMLRAVVLGFMQLGFSSRLWTSVHPEQFRTQLPVGVVA
jgi:hypothetical protein